MSVEAEPGYQQMADGRVDLAMVWLQRLTMAHDWSPLVAARRLIMCVDGDVRVLRTARARVAHGVLVRPSATGSRALAMLDVAIAESESSD